MTTGTKYLTALLFSAYLCGVINGTCRLDLSKTDVTVFKTKVEYCEYEGLKLLPGSVVKNYEKCEEATCNKGSMSTCGIGINAGPPQDPGPDCVIIADGCQPRVVSTRSAVCSSSGPYPPA